MVAGTHRNLQARGHRNHQSANKAGKRRVCPGAFSCLRIRDCRGREANAVVNGWGIVVVQAAKGILLVVSALFPIVDPIGGAPVFLSLTLNYDTQTRRLLSRRIAVNSFILLLASCTVGSHLLSFFG